MDEDHTRVDRNNAMLDPAEYGDLQFHDPTWVDHLMEYWSDFMNYVETLSIWEYFRRSDEPFSGYSYKQMKETTIYFLDRGTIKLTFDDFMLVLTIFVLFGENIELITLGPYAGMLYQYY
jgi:hypothetical protein